MMRWCWVHFQCRDVLLISIILGQGPTAALAVGADADCLEFFPSSIISLWETSRYRLKYCLKLSFEITVALVISNTNVSKQLSVTKNIQSTLVISKSKGPSETVRDIRTSTYQICRIEENNN